MPLRSARSQPTITLSICRLKTRQHLPTRFSDQLLRQPPIDPTNLSPSLSRRCTGGCRRCSAFCRPRLPRVPPFRPPPAALDLRSSLRRPLRPPTTLPRFIAAVKSPFRAPQCRHPLRCPLRVQPSLRFFDRASAHSRRALRAGHHCSGRCPSTTEQTPPRPQSPPSSSIGRTRSAGRPQRRRCLFFVPVPFPPALPLPDELRAVVPLHAAAMSLLQHRGKPRSFLFILNAAAGN